MATLTAQRAVDTSDLPELENIKNSNYNNLTFQGQYTSSVNPPLYAHSTSYRFDPFEIDLVSSVDGIPGDLEWLLGETFAGTFREIVVRDIGNAGTTDAYTVNGFSLELDTDLFADAQDGKLDSVPAKMFQGDDSLNGSPFADRLFAFAGADTVNGNAGDDVINGGDGADQLNGGLGRDTMTGGGDADTFIFDVAPNKANRDVIEDFQPGTDVIHLDQSFFAKLKLGELKAKAFVKGNGLDKAEDGKDRIIYDKSDGEVRYDSDGTGKAKAKVIALLTDSPNKVSHDDFFVIA